MSAPAAAAAAATVVDEFPNAPIVPFPVEATSPAITSLANVLVAAGAPAIVLSADRTVKFVTDEMRRVFSAAQSDVSNLAQIERVTGVKIGDITTPATWSLASRKLIATLVPLSGGAGGAVLVFRSADTAAAAEETSHTRAPRVADILRNVVDRFAPFSELKGIRLQIDARDLEERFRDHDDLADSLGILIDNALHYVPPGGQVVVGARLMDYKGKPLLLLFVMDNGPLVPEHMRSVIFEPGFVWNASLRERTGRSLSKVRDFAMRHSGSVWTEAKSGKACTFFLRVRPDGSA